MTIRIIGNGLLGSSLKKELEKDFEVFQYTRDNFTVEDTLKCPENPTFFFGYDDIVLNACGAIPQKKYSYDEFNKINNLFPKYISKRCKEVGARMIHFSTPDVFSGMYTIKYTKYVTGNYDESCYPDPSSIYGYSKSLGEHINKDSMVIRCSFIGLEKDTNYSLMSWFLKENKTIFGYTNHIWNGLEVNTLSKCIKQLINNNFYSPGIFHLFSPVAGHSKYDILKMINEIYSAKKDLKKFKHHYPINRTLTTNNKWFIDNFNIPTIKQQIMDGLKCCL